LHPAFSVLFLTTLIGAAQGLVIALFAAQLAGDRLGAGAAAHAPFYVVAALVAVVLAVAGMIASVFHLGRPERAWRAATQWRTSWLSREVVVLPAFVALALAYGLAHALARPESIVLGALASLAALALFVCTGMIYACVRVLREWATVLTPINFTLFGCANGFTLAAGLAAFGAPDMLRFFASGAIAFTVAALAGRLVAWRRNATLAPRTTLQTAIGIRHPRIEQRSQGFVGGSFNTREFFHGRSARTLRWLRWSAIAGAFALPVVLDAAGVLLASIAWTLAAFVIQYLGLLAERWLFFAEANHTQNLYYQRAA
jgi:DMSO reductase anchor subunit